MCSERKNSLNLSFPASFSLVHFFWRSKRNEQLNIQDLKTGAPTTFQKGRSPGSS
jgi:hypothetical protein